MRNDNIMCDHRSVTVPYHTAPWRNAIRLHCINKATTKGYFSDAMEEPLLVPLSTMSEKELCEREKPFKGLKNLHIM